MTACFLMTPRPPISTLFPYTTLFRSSVRRARRQGRRAGVVPRVQRLAHPRVVRRRARPSHPARDPAHLGPGDRKSTRLNSSHVAISYAVFCLKKKKQRQKYTEQKKKR